METTVANSSNERADRARFIPANISRETGAMLAGFSSLVAWVQLYDTCLLVNDVPLFNYCLYGSIAQLAAFVAIAYVSAKFSWAPSSRMVGAGSVVGALGMAIGVASPGAVVSIIGAVAAGVASAVLSVSWGVRLVGRSARSNTLLILGAFLAATILSFACSAIGNVFSDACGIVLPLLAGVFLMRTKTPATQPEHASRPKDLPWPFLIILAVCCLSGSFFVGLALNPYIFQSGSVSRFGYLFSLVAFAAMLAWASATSRPKTQIFFAAALILLLVGLFLFSSGLLGSIIMPLGFILAAKSCFVALCWITFSVLAGTGGFPSTLILSCGLLLCNGTLGRTVGMLVNNHMAPSFPDIALVASISIVIFTLFYAFMVASHPGTNRALAPTLADPDATIASDEDAVEDEKPEPEPEPEPEPPTAEELLDRAHQLQAQGLYAFNLTPQERRVARLILQEMTYQQIADHCEITERTVKYHAGNVFRKTGTECRRDFEYKMRVKDDPSNRVDNPI